MLLCAPESEPLPWLLSGMRRRLAGSPEAGRLRRPESVVWGPMLQPPRLPASVLAGVMFCWGSVVGDMGR